MFRRARLSVKPNVRPGVGARGSTAPNPHRGRESPRPPEPTAESAPKPVEPTDVPAVDSGGAEPQEKAPRSSDEKIGTENNVEESSKLSSTVSQRRKRISSTSSFVKPSVSLPSQSHPLSAVNQDAPQPNPIPTKEKQPCSDRYRIYKAQKLREMLKEELRKEKKQWKNKYAINESQRPPDRSKMTMRDFIYYLPDNNPMTSSLEQEKKTEKLLAPVQSRDRQENKSTVDVEDNEEMEEETDDGPLLVPRVKVAEDGSIILDEESLTVEVLRTKGPCVVEENDPIFERGSTTTYSSFRKNYYSKPWSNKETDMFFLAISMVGTDFSMIGQLFPHRARIEIKNKFKREEKTNGWRIDKAFQEKRPFDFDFFAHLLQKVLAEEEKRKQKSIKSQSLKEKKSSKPRKNVKVKKVASEGVNDDPDESLSTKISDAQEDAQTVEESLTLPEQDLEQVALEQDQSEKKRRRKNQDDANEQEVKNLLGNASVHSAPLKGEKHKNKSLSSRPEVNDGECNMEQKLLYAQSRDDSVSLASGEKVEKRADPVLSESNQQDTIPLAAESSELSTSDLPPSKVGIRTSCDVNNAESNTGEISFDLKNKSLETDQVENVKPVLRSRLQKPKPNLSRAVGKKSILSQNKTDAESKSVCSETSVEKNHVEKNKVNTGDCFEMENTERENLEAESVSNLNEKTCLQEDNQPKAFRPSRPLRGRLLRPRPNIGKAEARKEILESQEEIGTDIENNENESCVDRDIPQQMEDQSCKNFRSKVSHVTSERKDSSFQKVQPDEPKTLKECLSIQEDKQANVIKQVPVSRTRFQKPKPNIGRRREVSSKEVPEEILTSGEKIAALREIVRLDTLPREKVSVTTTTAKEMKSDLKETGRDISLSEKMPEMTDITVEMQTGLKAIEREISPRGMISEMTDSTVQKETDLRTPGREISPREKVQELTVAIEEIDRNVEETEIREIVPQQNVQEIKSVGDMETDLKKTGREMPTQDRTPQKINVTEERETDLEETEGREISALIKVSEEVRTIDELKTDLKEMREEISQREKVLVKVSVVGERKIVLKETGRDISLMKNISGEMSTIKGMETDLKDTGRDISLMETISEKMTAIEGIEADLKDTGRDIALMETISGEMTAIEGTEADLKDTGRDISLMQTTSGEMITTEGVETDLKNTGRNISLMETTSEEMTAIEGMEAYLKDTGRDISLMETISGEMITTEGVEANLKDTERDIALMETISGKMTAIEGMETDLKDTGRDIALMETISEEMIATEGMEADLKDTRRDISLMETISGGMITTKGVEADLNDTGRDIALMETISGEMITTEGVEADLNDTGRDIAPMETISGEMIATEGVEADLKDTGRKNSLRKRGSVKIGVTEEMVADLEKTGKTDISPRENESEEPSKQTKANVMQSSSVDIITIPSLDMKTISSEVLSVMHIPTEENKNSEKEVSCHLSHLKTSSQTSELGETEDQRIRLPDVPEQFSDISLSKSLPQEQKPLEVKPAPFVRSQLKRPKPNLTRAALKKETTEAQKYAPGKKLETEEAETIVIQQDGEQASTLTSQPDMASLVPSKEKDKSSHKEEVMTLPCIQTEKDPSSSNSYEPKEESQTAQTQENELVVSIGTPEINPFPQEVKESAIQTSGPVRGRLQRPKPNVRKARHRQIVENDEAKGIIKEERAILQKNESNKKSLTVSNSQIETEIEVVPSKVSECRMNENQNPMVLVENLHVNERNVLDEKMRLENKPYIPSPAQSIRRKFQKTKPNLGRAHSKKEEPGIEKGTYRSKTSKPEDNLQQQGNSDIHFFPKEKTETLSSVEVTARKYFVGCRESSLAKKNAQLEEVGPSVSAGEENIGTNSVSSVVEEQYLSKVTSHPQLLKESNSSKISLDRRTTITTASVCEIDHSERRVHRKIKPNVTKGRGSKRTRGKTSKKEPRASKSMLVTLRASQEEEEDDAEDFESDYEEENYHLAPEELNKAPVFVPIGLRSPEPVSAQIEETMEELEITENVADIGCVTVVEHQLSNTDIATQEVKEEKNLNTSSFEITAGEQTQDEPGTNDGSTEAAITLLTMGDLVLQSEISTEQGDVGVCVFPDVQSEDKSHIPFSPANVNDKIVHEYQELSSPIISTPPASFEENKIVLEEQSTREVGLMQEVKENATLTRNTTSKVTNNMRMRSRFIKPKPNLEKILRTKRFHVNQKDPSFCVLKGEEVEIPRETETNASKATELEEKRLGQIITTESKEQNQLSCVHDIKGTSISQEPNFTERNEDQEERSQEVTPVVSSEQGPHTFDSGRGLGESSFEEPLIKDTKGDSVLTFLVPECIPTSIPEVQQENVINPEDLTVNLFADVHQDGEDEQAFILTLVEIPTNATEEFADATSQLMPNPLLPAPILVKSVNTEEIGDLSKSAPLTSVGQDAMCLTNSARDDSEEPPANLDLISRKRFHCRLDESNHVPPAKKSSLTSRDDCQQYTPEVCSKKLNVFEETGESYKGRGIFPTSGCTHATAEPQKEKLETTFQNVGSRSVDKIRDTYVEKNMPQLTQDEMVVSDKEKRTDSASTSEQMGSRTASSKTPLSRPGRRPLGFLSLICSKNNLESDEPTHVHSKKRLKPLIPVSRRNLKRSNPLNEDQKKNQESSDLLPSPSVVTNTQSENIGSSSAQVSCDQPLLKEERKTGQNRAPEQEPTSVSEYFFSDIFIEVDETE